MADERNVCGHEICSCPVNGDDEYCSEICKEAGKAGLIEIACDCGHGGCSTV